MASLASLMAPDCNPATQGEAAMNVFSIGEREPPRVVIPKIPEDLLASVAMLPNREKIAREIGASRFRCDNGEAAEYVSRKPILERENHEQQVTYARVVRQKHATDQFHYHYEPDPDRPITVGKHLTNVGLAAGFVGSVGLLWYCGATYVFVADIFPQIKELWQACLYTGIVGACFVGVPIAHHDLLRTDAEKWDFAAKAGKIAIRLGVGWIVLLAVVVALDDYCTVHLVRHRFRGSDAWLNVALPVGLEVAKAFVIMTQLGAEAAGCVSLKLFAARIANRCKRMVSVINPHWQRMEDVLAQQRPAALRAAAELAQVQELEATLVAERECFMTRCAAYFTSFEKNKSLAVANAEAQFINNIGSRKNA
jgi:hypothetical protein